MCDVLHCITISPKLNERRRIKIPYSNRNVEHTSFWMNPLNVEFIRAAAKTSRMAQGTILETIISYYRLTRKKEQLEAQGRKLTAHEEDKLKRIYYLLRVIPY